MTDSETAHRLYGDIAARCEAAAEVRDAAALECRQWGGSRPEAVDRGSNEQRARDHERKAAELRERARQARARQQSGTDGPLQSREARDLGRDGQLRFEDVRRGTSKDAREARAAFGFGRGHADAQAFTTIDAPRGDVYYRVTADAGDGARPWYFSESQFAQFTTKGEFDGDKWRAWAAVRPGWQEEAHEIHVLHVDRERPFVAHEGLVSAQDMTEGSKVAYMGSSRQTYLEQAHVRRIETWSTESPQLQARIRELSARHPDAGKLVGHREEARPTPGAPGSQRERWRRAIEAKAHREAGPRHDAPTTRKK